MRERQDSLNAAGLRVFAVTFESAKQVRAFRDRESICFPILRDPRRHAYRACGIDRTFSGTVWSPSTMWYYMRQALRGRFPRARAADMIQLGGDVILAPDGQLCWVYASDSPADRPDVDQIVRKANECRDR